MIAALRLLDFVGLLSNACFSGWGTYLALSGRILEGAALCAAVSLAGIHRAVSRMRYDIRGEDHPLQ